MGTGSRELASRVQQLDEQIATVIRGRLRHLQDELSEHLSRSTASLHEKLAAVESVLPASFLGHEDVRPLTEEARTAGRAHALDDLREALTALDHADSQQALLAALLEQAGRFASRSALFLLRPEHAQGWGSYGFTDSERPLAELAVSYEDSAGWQRLTQEGRPVLLAPAESATLASRLGSAIPREAVLVPLVLADRLAAVLYADRLNEGDRLETSALLTLTYVAGQALELQPLRTRPSTPTLAWNGDAGLAGDVGGDLGVGLWSETPPQDAAQESEPQESAAQPEVDTDATWDGTAPAVETEAPDWSAAPPAPAGVTAESPPETAWGETSLRAGATWSPPSLSEPFAAPAVEEVAWPPIETEEEEEVTPAAASGIDVETATLSQDLVAEVFAAPSWQPEPEVPLAAEDEEAAWAVEASPELPAFEVEDVTPESWDDTAVEPFQAEPVAAPMTEEPAEHAFAAGDVELPELDLPSPMAPEESPAPTWETPMGTALWPPAAPEPVQIPEAPVAASPIPELSWPADPEPTPAPSVPAPAEPASPIFEAPAPGRWEAPTETFSSPVPPPAPAFPEIDLTEDATILLQRPASPPPAAAAPSPPSKSLMQTGPFPVFTPDGTFAPPPAPPQPPSPPAAAINEPEDETHPNLRASTAAAAATRVMPRASGPAEVRAPSGFEGPGLAFSSSSRAAASGAETPGHEEARRLARLLVSEIRLYNEEQVEEGRRNRDIYNRLRDEIDRSRKMYEERIAADVRASRDYFTEELVRRLADGDPDALGM